MAKRETGLKEWTLGYLNGRRGWFAEKRHGTAMGRSGLPDIGAVYCGLSAQLELKAPGAKPSSLQAHYLRMFNSAGAIARWADSREGVEAFVAVVEYEAARRVKGAPDAKKPGSEADTLARLPPKREGATAGRPRRQRRVQTG